MSAVKQLSGVMKAGSAMDKVLGTLDDDRVTVTVINLIADAGPAEFVRQFMTLRKETFVYRKGWDLAVQEDIEWEQYDCFDLAYYAIAIENGVVVGGARLLRCDAVIGTGTLKYSYMIRDAYLGLIDLPREMCREEPPVDKNTWEITRFTVRNGRSEVTRHLLAGVNDFLVAQGATRSLFLGSPAFMRMGKRYGFRPEPLGPVCGNQDGRFVAFSCNLLPGQKDLDGDRSADPVRQTA